MRRRKLDHGTRECGSKNESKAKKLKAELDRKHKNEAEHTISSAKVVKHDRYPAGGRRNNPRSELLTKKAGEYIFLTRRKIVLIFIQVEHYL